MTSEQAKQLRALADHRAPTYSPERLAYFEACMDRYASHGDRHLVFTPPSDRGSLITHCEAWALNVQGDYVPTLREQGQWPAITAGDRPDAMSHEQSGWLSEHWGECASLWVQRGCPRPSVASLNHHKEQKQRHGYADLVLKTYSDFEHEKRREILERRAQAEWEARQRL